MSAAPALESIRTLTEACELCWRGSGIAAKDMAGRLGIEYGHFVRMFRAGDSRHFPPDLIPALMNECKSELPLEWLAFQRGKSLHEKSLTVVLEAIRDALVADGKAPRFSVNNYGTVEEL